MPETRIADLFQTRSRFLRSAHLERDFADDKALRGYIVTPQIRASLCRLAAGLASNSGHRAWRITGDYGTGKSSFALALAHILSGRQDHLPGHLRHAVDLRRVTASRPRLFPVLVTGSREAIAAALLRALQRALENASGRSKPRVLQRIASLAETASRTSVSEAAVLKLLYEAGEYVRATGRWTGILIVVDELGKFLEFAAVYPERQDVYFLQALAEAASRSGKAPLFFVGLLHQGFNAYADHLSQAAQREWEKVAGRFEELLFKQPLEQTASLVADALNIRMDRLPARTARLIEAAMASAVDLGWYGVDAPKRSLLTLASRLYPIHPTVLPVLVNLFGRFGQNERSLFSFLLSDEPFALKAFAQQPPRPDRFYRLHHLYDYARVAFGHRLSVQSYRSHWNQIESVIESFPASDETELQVLKTVGVLNLLDAPSLVATHAAIAACIAGVTPPQYELIQNAVAKVHKTKRVLYYRGDAGGYCLWPHTSVNLERAYEDAGKALGSPQRISSLIAKELETRPLVARRHYIETGNLRHFEVRYESIPELPSRVEVDVAEADGRILIPLCETPAEREEAIAFAQSDAVRKQPMLLVAVPTPLSSLAGLVQETRRWEWVIQNVPELNHDTYAAEEVSRQIAASRQVLNERVQSFVGLRQFTGRTELQWFWRGEPLSVANGRELLAELSKICDVIYSKAPHVRNELVNRRSLSSAATAARMRLIERLFRHATLPLLGMDSHKKPPEMSMYLSVLQASRLHRETDEGLRVVEPAGKDDPCHLRHALRRIMEFLEQREGRRLRVSELFAELRRPPYGVRDGLHPLLLSVFAIVHEHEIAFYENDGFLRHVTGDDFLRLMKGPETFEVQLCRIAGLRGILFERLLGILGVDSQARHGTDLLEVVRPLCAFAAHLPAYTHKTQRLSQNATAVRATILAAREPSSLVFNDLPRACGFQPFLTDRSGNTEDVQRFVVLLRAGLEELRAAYPTLLEQMKTTMLRAFNLPEPFEEAKKVLAETADGMLVVITEPQLKAFCLRLADTKLPETEWLESIGSIVCAKPPSKWLDRDVDLFDEELGRVAGRFHRVESMTFARRKRTANGNAVRVAVTRPDGAELDRVLYTSAAEEPRIAELETEFSAMLTRSKRIGIAAASRALWKAMSNVAEQDHE
jgi:hypothetical protein